MERTRAWRRHQLRRRKHRAFRVAWHENKFWHGNSREAAWRYAKRMANHLSHCSCVGCGNPRRYFNKQTLAETRFESSWREQVMEYEREESCRYRLPRNYTISSRTRSI